MVVMCGQAADKVADLVQIAGRFWLSEVKEIRRELQDTYYSTLAGAVR